MAGNKICSHCESVIPADSESCPNCGAGFEAVEPEINQFQPVSPPPPSFQTTQAPVSPGFSTPTAKPPKSKKLLYIIIAVVVAVVLCICVLGVIAILSLRSSGQF